MPVDAILVIGAWIYEIVCEADHGGEFVPGLRIEIGVAAAAVDRAMTDTDIGEII